MNNNTNSNTNISNGLNPSNNSNQNITSSPNNNGGFVNNPNFNTGVLPTNQSNNQGFASNQINQANNQTFQGTVAINGTMQPNTSNPNLNTLNTINQSPNQTAVPNPNNIKIEETTVTKSQKGTITVASVVNGTVNVLTDQFPAPIDISPKMSKVVTKNGKRVRIMTKRELITNIALSFFFVLILCGVGYGTYYYIFKNNPRNFETKNITIELGDEIPQSVLSYINLTDVSEPDYTLDLSQVKEEIGTYTYKVSYGNTVKSGTLTINDTKAPVITFKDVKEFSSGTVITKEMLVDSCEDITDCTYELTNPVDTSNVGEVIASITAKDNLGNSADYTISLNIYEKLTHLICTKTGLNTDENNKMLLENSNYNLSFTMAKVLKTGNLKVIRTYLSDSDYTSIKDNLQASGYILEEANKRATKDSEIDNVANLTNQDEVRTHLESNGYTCSISEE